LQYENSETARRKARSEEFRNAMYKNGTVMRVECIYL
jgi:hypothetical protein